MKKKHAKVFDVGNLTTFNNQKVKPGITEIKLNSPKNSVDLIFTECKNPESIKDLSKKTEQVEKQDCHQENENKCALSKKHYISPEESFRSN